MKNDRLRRGKLIGKFNIAWTDQNLLRKHCSSSRLITQGQVQKIQENNDNISGRQNLITPTSETKKKYHPGPTGDNSQKNGKDNDQTLSNNKSKGKPSKKKREAIKRRQ
ncbi:hypothetical protein R3W88_004188 [Solanum pinnatisectum]|uniref:Uncharacterized protein n=1 Tax=Solanum pinnatisectum TaxID=50273 RepID=A0AAV9K8L0_9SOLN|nr:hypothetical protein R3W88_004188 [Solanum pinnatisectum]